MAAISASVTNAMTLLIIVHIKCTTQFKGGMGLVEAVGLGSVPALVSITSDVGAEER